MNIVVPKMKQIRGMLAACMPLGFVSCARHDAHHLPEDGPRITSVDIRPEGGTKIDQVRLTKLFQSRAGSVYTVGAVDRGLRALYETGQVEDIRVLAETIGTDIRLVIAVRPLNAAK